MIFVFGLRESLKYKLGLFTVAGSASDRKVLKKQMKQK